MTDIDKIKQANTIFNGILALHLDLIITPADNADASTLWNINWIDKRTVEILEKVINRTHVDFITMELILSICDKDVNIIWKGIKIGY